MSNPSAFRPDLLNVVHVLHRSLSLSIGGISNEPETTTAAGISVFDDNLKDQHGPMSDNTSGRNLLPPRQNQTQRTCREEWHHQCARQGLCMIVSNS